MTSIERKVGQTANYFLLKLKRQSFSCFQKRDLFQYVRAKKYNIICLQDVHINDNIESVIKAEKGYVF